MAIQASPINLSNIAYYGMSPFAPSIGYAPVVNTVASGGPVTYVPALQVGGWPIPSLRHDLYVNGVLQATGYVSGAYVAANVGDSYVITAVATNSQGSATLSSSPNSAIATSTARLANIPQRPVVGQQISYNIENATSGSTVQGLTILNQQWYRNTGYGPVPIPGATGATVQVFSGDNLNGVYYSVRGNTTDGTFSSLEFGQFSALGSSTGVSTPLPSGLSTVYCGQSQTAYSFNAPTKMYCYYGTYYEYQTVGPGPYPSYFSGFTTDLAPYTGGANVNLLYINFGSASPIVQQPDTAPATATRPAYNTGTGFFVLNGALYDANGVKFKIRGVNQAHWDGYPPGKFTTKANTWRIFMDLSQDWATKNQPLIASHLTPSAAMVPMITNAGCFAIFSATISGTTMTVTSVTSGLIVVGSILRLASAGSSSAVLAHITAIASGGGTGTYTLDTSLTYSSSTQFLSGTATSGSSDVNVLAASVLNFTQQRSNFAAYDKYLLINMANEWGPTTGTTWRDSYITQVAAIRNAGYLNTLIIDAPGSGQDATGAGALGWAFTTINANGKTFAQEVWESDSQRNIVFSVHIYGNTRPGDLSGLFAKMNALSASTGMCFIVGEFGPKMVSYNGGSLTLTDAKEVMYTATAYNIGFLAWALDDPASDTADVTTYAMIMNAGNYNVGGGGYQATTGTITSFTILTPGSGYTNGTYISTQLSGGTGSGAFVTIVVSGGVVTDINLNAQNTLTTGGHGYVVGDTVTATIAGGSGFTARVAAITSFPNGNPQELTKFGRDTLLDAYCGIQTTAVPATIF